MLDTHTCPGFKNAAEINGVEVDVIIPRADDDGLEEYDLVHICTLIQRNDTFIYIITTQQPCLESSLLLASLP